jgi:FkbM family methyltransferase
MTTTFKTKYGTVDVPTNELYIIEPFKMGSYWDIDTMLKVQPHINPLRNIIEIGGHVGTSTLVYRSFLKDTSKIWVFEPQARLYDILSKNILQNHSAGNTFPIKGAAFCYTGEMHMNDTPLDGTNISVSMSIINDAQLQVNYGGISIGSDGERIKCFQLDKYTPELDNIGFIHCDAQGSDPFALWGAKDIIARCRPVIFFEDKALGAGPIFYDHVCKHYPQYAEQSKFDVISYCMDELNYTKAFRGFNNSENNLLIP